MDRLTRAAIKEVEQQEKTPRTEAAFNAYIQSASPIPFRDEMRKLETELIAERETRRNAEKVCMDALAARDRAERDRDKARAQRDDYKGRCERGARIFS
jgi:hypothetical protein